MSPKIFISYRRDDVAGDARGIRDGLAAKFGRADVFMDVDDLVAGQRFDEALAKALDSCDVLIAVIGPRWMELLRAKMASGERDYVREEIAEALMRRIAVIPVRVGREGQMPALPHREELPSEVRDLVLYQRHDVAHERFSRDIEGLSEAILAVRKTSRPQSVGARTRILWGWVGIAAAGAVAVVSAALYFTGGGKGPSTAATPTVSEPRETRVAAAQPTPKPVPSPAPQNATPSGWLGVTVQDVSEEAAVQLGLAEAKGAIVATVVADSPAAKVGLKAQDAILAINSERVIDSRDLPRTLASMAPGTVVELRVWRDRAEQRTKVTLGAGLTRVTVRPTTGILSVSRVPYLSSFQIIHAGTGKEMGSIGSFAREQELPAGVYHLKLAAGWWKGIEVSAGGRRLIDPPVLRVENLVPYTSVEILDAETRRTQGTLSLGAEHALAPGHFVPKINDYGWPPIQMTPGQTTVLRLSKIRVSNPRSQFYNVRPAGGGPERSFQAVNGINVPPGAYQVWRSDSPFAKTDVQVTGDNQEIEIKAP